MMFGDPYGIETQPLCFYSLLNGIAVPLSLTSRVIGMGLAGYEAKSYLHRVSWIACITLDGLRGMSHIAVPNARLTAIATAAIGAHIGVSPTPRTP